MVLRSRAATWGLVAACVIAAFWKLSEVPRAFTDSWAPMQAAIEVLEGPDRDRLYEDLFFDRGIKFQYPVTSLFYVKALRAVGIGSIPGLNLVNWFLLVATAGLAAALAWQLFRGSRWEPYRPAISAAAFLSTVLYFPSAIALRAGQIQVFSNLLFVGACLGILRAAEVAPGVLTGLATLIKPQLAPYFLVALLRRQRRFAVAMAAVVASVTAISALVFGLGNQLSYLKVLRFISRHGESYFWNNSVNGIMHRLLGNGSATDIVKTEGIWHSPFPPFNATVYVVTLVSGIAFLALPFVASRLVPPDRSDRVTELLLFVLTGLALVMASPVAWVHHYAVLLPAFLVLLRAISDEPPGPGSPWMAYLLGFSYLLTAFDYPYLYDLTGLPSLIYVPTFAGALVVLGLLLLVVRNRGRDAAQKKLLAT